MDEEDKDACVTGTSRLHTHHNSPSVIPIPARMMGDSPTRVPMRLPVNGATGEWSWV